MFPTVFMLCRRYQVILRSLIVAVVIASSLSSMVSNVHSSVYKYSVGYLTR